MTEPTRAVSHARAAAAGTAGAAVALAVTELLGGFVPGLPPLVVAVGSEVIDRVPNAVKELAIAVFGLADKLALNLGIGLVTLAVGAVLGVAARRRPLVARAGFLGLGTLGALAALDEADAVPLLVVAGTALAVAAGLATLGALLTVARRDAPPAHPPPSIPADEGRRRFLVLVASACAAAALSAAIGRRRFQRLGRPADIALPAPTEPVVAPPPEGFQIPGLTPLVVPNDDFYRIDVNLTVPRVDVTSWRLRVTGLVDRPVELPYDDLLAMPLVERAITLACVSNEVGGDLVGTALWRGVPLVRILDLAGVQPGATQLVGRSVDGFTVGFPTAVVRDGRDALVAVGMNGEPLPPAHGFPARLVVPGLYGYVSATKWLAELELTTWEAFDAYWVKRGWAKQAPVKTQSRIDVPRPGRTRAGRLVVAGVAWAPNVGIERVELAVDGGPWREAELSPSLSDDGWRQWRLPWHATAGEHVLRVRATDRSGVTQTAEVQEPFPDGATGYHTVRVRAV